MSAYHEAFWVAVTAAAPVVALAHVVAVGDIHRAKIRAYLSPESKRPLPHRGRPSLFVGLLALANIGWDATAMVFGLWSIQDATNGIEPHLTAFLLGLSLLQVVTVSRLTTRAVALEFGQVE